MVKLLAIIVYFIIFCSFSLAQEGREKIKMEFEFKIDKVGDAVIIYRQSATASQWNILNQIYGQNPSLIRRDLQHQLSAYELYDFNFEKDDMNRTFILTFRAKGVAKYKGNGVWDINVAKDFSPKKISERNWYLTSIQTQGNVIYEAYISINLPKGVKESEITNDEFGKRVLRYKVSLEKELPIYLIASGFTAALGIVLLGASFLFRKRS